MARNTLKEMTDILFDQMRAINDTAVDEDERRRRVSDGLAIARLGAEVTKAMALQLRAIETKDRFEAEYGSGDYGLSMIACDEEE